MGEIKVLINKIKKKKRKLLFFFFSFFLFFFFSFTLWGLLFFGVFTIFPFWDLFQNSEIRTIFVRALFGPMTPTIWRIEQINQHINNYGITGIGFVLKEMIKISYGFLYIVLFGVVIQKYFRKETIWNDWKLGVLVIIFSLFWSLWGESHIAIGV